MKNIINIINKNLTVNSQHRTIITLSLFLIFSTFILNLTHKNIMIPTIILSQLINLIFILTHIQNIKKLNKFINLLYNTNIKKIEIIAVCDFSLQMDFSGNITKNFYKNQKFILENDLEYFKNYLENFLTLKLPDVFKNYNSTHSFSNTTNFALYYFNTFTIYDVSNNNDQFLIKTQNIIRFFNITTLKIERLQKLKNLNKI